MYSQDARIRAMHVFSQEILLQRSLPVRIIFQCLVLVSKLVSEVSGHSMRRHTRYAEKAPGLAVHHQSRFQPSREPTYNTVIQPNADSNGLSRILLILYSTKPIAISPLP